MLDPNGSVSARHQGSLSCFVLMPFHGAFTFVYEYAIKPAFKTLETEKAITFSVQRADERLAVGEEKVREVRRLIETNDLLVVDITGDNPNVLWELGYAQALGKHVIPLSQSPDKLPFNLRGLDVLSYTFSVEGLGGLQSQFVNKLRSLVGGFVRRRSSLLFDDTISRLIREVQRGLEAIPSQSLLHNLARNDIQRLHGRIRGLTDGKFDLRNEKPNKEIIQYFCDYIKQLKGEHCSFDTITHRHFWKAITDGGSNWEYVNANVQAAHLGATIRRIFIVDRRTNPDRLAEEFLAKVINKQHGEARHLGDRMQLRVLFSEDFEDDSRQYGNFGILRQDGERLLFVPKYLPDGSMKETWFRYDSEDRAGKSTPGDQRGEIESYEMKFKRAWEMSKPVVNGHFAGPIPTSSPPAVGLAVDLEGLAQLAEHSKRDIDDAISWLQSEGQFAKLGPSQRLRIAARNGRFFFEFSDASRSLPEAELPDTELTRQIKNYVRIINLLEDRSNMEKIHDLEQARRTAHDKGAQHLATLCADAGPDHHAARRLFTLLVALHGHRAG